MTLPVSRLINVSVSITPAGAVGRNFSNLLILGDSNVISGLERIRSYSSLTGVGEDFSTTDPEYLGAEIYFQQRPKPTSLSIGRWLRTATSAILEGAILTSSQSNLSLFTSITSGGFNVTIDGTLYMITGLNFSSALNLNGVASLITTGLSGAGTCIWTGSQFEITSATTGAGVHASGTVTFDTNASYGVQASGTATLGTNPQNGDTLEINSTTITFVSGTPSGNQVAIGLLNTDTAANLQAFLSSSVDAGLSACTYNTIGDVTTITAIVYGTAGNAYTLATTSGGRITVSGSGDLAGGVAPDTLTVNGTAITFVKMNPSGNEVIVGTTNENTAVNLNTFLNASADSNIDQASYSVSSNVVTVSFKSVGTAGNSFTLAKSSSHISLSGANLSGGINGSSVSYLSAPGSGQDISSLLGMRSNQGLPLIPGYDAETALQAVEALDALSTAWYGLSFASSVMPSDDDDLEIAAFIEADLVTRMFGVTIQNTNCLSSLVTNDLGSLLKAQNYEQTFTQYSSSNPYAAISIFGRLFTVNFDDQNTAINLMYKQEPGITPEVLTTDQANVLQAKRINVYVSYDNGTSIIQYGTMAGPVFIDETYNVDWFQNAVQVAVFNVNFTTPTKVPQTDQGQNLYVNAVSGICQKAVNNGVAAPGTWNSAGFGQLQQGQYLKTGYYVFAPPVALQSESDRAARKSVPIQAAVKFAGATNTVDVLVTFNQ